jgi:hypothetical protein
MTRPSNFEEFWPDYLRAHSEPNTRALHVVGTAAGLGCAAMFLLSGRPRWLLGALATAYGSAWAGHALFEKNTPATFSHPLWSLRGDIRMVRMAVSGTLDKELRRTGVADADGKPISEESRATRIEARETART